MDAKDAIVHAAISLHDTMGFEVRGLFARIDCHKNRLADLQKAIADFRKDREQDYAAYCEARREIGEEPLLFNVFLELESANAAAHDIAGKVRAETMQLLADGLRKFAPDLAEEIIVRWKSALPDEWVRLERFLDVMKDES